MKASTIERMKKCGYSQEYAVYVHSLPEFAKLVAEFDKEPVKINPCEHGMPRIREVIHGSTTLVQRISCGKCGVYESATDWNASLIKRDAMRKDAEFEGMSIPKSFAGLILDMAEALNDEGIGPNPNILVEWIKRKYPTLK